MTPRKLFPALILLAAALAAAASACGGDDDSGSVTRPGTLTDPDKVPTASPWVRPPEVVLVDPDNITPVSGGAPAPTGDGGDGEPTPEPGVCGETYTVVSGDSFSLIAEKCGVDLQDLLDANPGVDPAALSIGQVIKLPQ
jgi:hypothetical protein